VGGRRAAKLGYAVAVVRDATADYSDEMMHAALGINIPNYASTIASTQEIVAAMPRCKPEGGLSETTQQCPLSGVSGRRSDIPKCPQATNKLGPKCAP
jgi:hypothetical protein